MLNDATLCYRKEILKLVWNVYEKAKLMFLHVLSHLQQTTDTSLPVSKASNDLIVVKPFKSPLLPVNTPFLLSVTVTVLPLKL